MDVKEKRVKLLMLLALLPVLLSGCITQLKQTKPIVPVKEYEKLLFGKLTADYVGNENCLKGCHTHDKLALDFKSSTMGDQLKESSSGMMVVDCESCHGPASEMMTAIEGLDVKKDRAAIIKAHKDNLLDYNTLPAGAKSLICLKCHTANATFNIHDWNGGVHARNEVTCSNCHPIHAGADLIAEPREISTLCESCHIDVKSQFALPSHHPVNEGRMYCTDCHDPHGTENEHLLRGMTVKETCGRCHPEKVGPFLFEHGDVTENCTTCHNQHGSNNNNLLKLPVTFLCKQCHPPHGISTSIGSNAMVYTRCTDCHSMIHGTDTPGTSSNPNNGGRFTR